MKTAITLVSIFLFTLAGTNSANAQWSGWSVWKKSECFKGISTRHRSYPSSIRGKERVQVEVRNSYPFSISVSTRLTQDKTERTIYRLQIPARETYKGGSTEAFLYKGKEFYFLHDKVRFEGDEYGNRYRPCDY